MEPGRGQTDRSASSLSHTSVRFARKQAFFVAFELIIPRAAHGLEGRQEAVHGRPLEVMASSVYQFIYLPGAEDC